MSSNLSNLTILACLIVFHVPDGSELRIDSSAIIAVRAVPMSSSEHVHPGVKTIVYTAKQNFGVTETPEMIEDLIKDCQ